MSRSSAITMSTAPVRWRCSASYLTRSRLRDLLPHSRPPHRRLWAECGSRHGARAARREPPRDARLRHDEPCAARGSQAARPRRDRDRSSSGAGTASARRRDRQPEPAGRSLGPHHAVRRGRRLRGARRAEPGASPAQPLHERAAGARSLRRARPRGACDDRRCDAAHGAEPRPCAPGPRGHEGARPARIARARRCGEARRRANAPITSASCSARASMRAGASATQASARASS